MANGEGEGCIVSRSGMKMHKASARGRPFLAIVVCFVTCLK